MSPRSKGARKRGLPQPRQLPEQRRQQQLRELRECCSSGGAMLAMPRHTPLSCWKLGSMLPMMVLLLALCLLSSLHAVAAAGAAVAAEQCRPAARGYSVLYGMQPPEPSAVQYWDRTASGVKVGRVRQVSVYVDAATECVAGLRVTYGNKPGVSHLMGTERGPGYVERLLVLDLDENISSVDVMYDAKCIRLLRWHTDSGRTVAAGSPDSAGSIHMATVVPTPNSWRLVSVRGTYGPGTLNSLQFAWGTVGCQEVADAGQPAKQARTAASKPAAASSTHTAKHASTHQAAHKHAAAGPLAAMPATGRRHSQQHSIPAVAFRRQHAASKDVQGQASADAAEAEAAPAEEAEPAAAQEAEAPRPHATRSSSRPRAAGQPASPQQASRRPARPASKRRASREHAAELAASSEDDSEWAVDGTPDDDAAEAEAPADGSTRQEEPEKEWDEGTGDADATAQQEPAATQGDSAVRAHRQGLQHLLRHTKPAAEESDEEASSSSRKSRLAAQTWQSSHGSAAPPAAAEPEASDDDSDEAALAARVIAKAVRELRQQQSQPAADMKDEAVSLDTDVSALLQKALHPPASDVAALQASGLLPQGFLEAAEEADSLAAAAAAQAKPISKQAAGEQARQPAGQASSGPQQQEPAKAVSTPAAPAQPAGASDALFPAAPRWLPESPSQQDAPAAPLAAAATGAAQPAPAAQPGPQGGSPSTLPSPPPATVADAGVGPGSSSQAGSTTPASNSSGVVAFRAVVPPAVSCTAAPERCSTAKVLGEAGFCAAVAPLTQPECVGGCCASMGKCGSSSCALSGLGGDVAGLRCTGLNNGLAPDSSDGSLCQHLACRLAVPGCQTAAAANGGAGSGTCVGKVVALGPVTKTHPAAMQLVGFPCLDVAPSSTPPLTIRGDHSARGHYVAGGWGVCNCNGALPASLAGTAPVAAGGSNTSTSSSSNTPAASSPSAAAPAPRQPPPQPGAAVAALGRQVVTQLAPNGITAQQLQAAIVSALGSGAGDAAAAAANAAAAQQLVAAAAAAGLLLPAGANAPLPAAAAPAPAAPGNSGTAPAAGGGAAGSSEHAAAAGAWLQQLAAAATGGIQAAAAAQQGQAQAGAGGATGSLGGANWLSAFMGPTASTGAGSGGVLPVQAAASQAGVAAGASSALPSGLPAAPRPPAYPVAPGQLVQAGAAEAQMPSVWLPPSTMAGSMAVQQQLYPGQVLLQQKQQQQQRPGVAVTGQLPYQAGALPALQQRPPPVMLGQLASQPYVQVLPYAGSGAAGAAGGNAAVRSQDVQQQQSGAQQLGSGLMNLLSAFVTAASKQQQEQQEQPEQQQAGAEDAGSSEPVMSEADEIAAAALADAHLAYAPASSGQQPRYNSQRAGAYSTQPVEVAASSPQGYFPSSAGGPPDTEVAAEGVFAMPGAPADPPRRGGARAAASGGRRAAVVGTAGRAAMPRASAPTYISNRYAAGSSTSGNSQRPSGGGGGSVWTASASPTQQQQPQQQAAQAQQAAGSHTGEPQRARRHARRGGGPSVASVDESDYDELGPSSRAAAAAAPKQQPQPQPQQAPAPASSNATQAPAPAQAQQPQAPAAAGNASTPAPTR